MAIQIKTIDVIELAEDARELMRANWQETGFDFDFDPDVARYEQLESAGILFAKAAYVDDLIVGYCTAIVVPHLHNKDVICAFHDALFIAPDHRGRAGALLMRAVEKEAKFRGAERMAWYTRAGTGVADMLKRRGYEPADVVMVKGL